MRLPSFRRAPRRKKSPFNNLGPQGLTCGQVTPQLWLGGELGPRDWDALLSVGATAVLNLQQEQQDVFGPDEQISAYLWLPAPDGFAPMLPQIVMGVAFIRAAVAAGQGVFVHCKAGQGRAPLICACYLITEGHSMTEAIRIVSKCRPRTMLTPAQNTRLREFAAAYQTSAHAKAFGHNEKTLADAALEAAQNGAASHAEPMPALTPGESVS